jgi:UDP-N-acetylmuramate: L-alanyl-gamma-D-glutamyl-meso-diaminopimelate ligase
MNEQDLVSREFDDRSLARIAFVRALPANSRIHIAGVCGTGTAAVLSLLKQLGHTVSGSDKAFYPPMGEVVRELADVLYEGYDASNLDDDPALVVIGNALSRGNPEVEAVIERGVPYASMPEVFSALLIGEREDCATSIVIAGTHGKTTTSAAMATLLDQAGREPGYFIGGVPFSLPGGLRLTESKLPPRDRIVVLEGDEYDTAFFAKYSKFHAYRPDVLVITSLEFDHADIFESLDDIDAEFDRLVRRMPVGSRVYACSEDEHLRELSRKWALSKDVQAEILSYGCQEDADVRLLERSPWCCQEVPYRKFGQELQIQLHGEKGTIFTPLSGKHNALNLLVCAGIAKDIGLNFSQIELGVRAFRGVRRRQDVLFDAGGITLIEDFAHHPSAVKTTLEGLQESYSDRRLVAVFEPRSNTSRRAVFQEDYEASFDAASLALVKKVEDVGSYSNTSSELRALDVDGLVEAISKRGVDSRSFETVEEIQRSLLAGMREGDVIVLMSNGDFGGLSQSLCDALQQRA